MALESISESGMNNIWWRALFLFYVWNPDHNGSKDSWNRNRDRLFPSVVSCGNRGQKQGTFMGLVARPPESN